MMLVVSLATNIKWQDKWRKRSLKQHGNEYEPMEVR